VVSIAQLASLAGRPISSCQGSKPVTFQLQGNKLTLSGAQIHQVPAASPRPVQGQRWTARCLFSTNNMFSIHNDVQIETVENYRPVLVFHLNIVEKV